MYTSSFSILHKSNKPSKYQLQASIKIQASCTKLINQFNNYRQNNENNQNMKNRNIEISNINIEI